MKTKTYRPIQDSWMDIIGEAYIVIVAFASGGVVGGAIVYLFLH